MIVPEDIVKQWYKQSHPIYKSFAFIFDNPLWQTRVPAGFSVCPYFWMSVLSFVLLRPFVYGVHYVLLPLLSLCGRPGRWVNKMGLRAMSFVFPGHPLHQVDAGGFVAWLLLFVLSFLAWFGTVLSFDIYKHAIKPQSSYVPFVTFWSVISLILITVVVGYYKYRTKNDSLACKVHAWYIVWAPAVLLSYLIFAPGESWHVVLALFSLIWDLIAGLGWLIWKGLYYAVAYGLYYAAYGIGWFAFHLAIWIWNVLTYSWGYNIPWWVWIFGLPAAFGYTVKKVFEFMPKSWFETKIIPVPDAGPEVDPESARRIKIAAWLRHIRYMADSSTMETMLITQISDWGYKFFDYNTQRPIFDKTEEYLSSKPYPGLPLLIDIIHDHIIETFWRPMVEKLVDAGIEVPTGPLYWSMVNKKGTAKHKMTTLVAKIREQNPGINDPEIVDVLKQMYGGYESYNYLAKVSEYTKSDAFTKAFNRIDKDVVEKDRRTKERQLRREQSVWRQWCKRTTGSLLDVAGACIDGLVKFGILCWKLCTAPFRFMWWCLRQIGILAVYTKMVIKAKKKGACPYFRFEKDEPPVYQPPSSDPTTTPTPAV